MKVISAGLALGSLSSIGFQAAAEYYKDETEESQLQAVIGTEATADK